jgi:hypothetical protein
VWVGCNWLRISVVQGFYEYDNEPPSKEFRLFKHDITLTVISHFHPETQFRDLQPSKYFQW